MPLDLARPGVQRENAIGIEIVAGAQTRIPRSCIPDAPIDRVEFGIERARQPCRAAAVLPCVAAVFPGLGTGLARCRDRVCAPQPLAVLGIVTLDIAANAVFTTGNADDQHAVRNQRGDRHRVAVLEVDRVRAPDFLTGLRIERDDIGIERRTEQTTIEDGDSSIDDTAACDPRCLCGVLDHLLPQLPAGERIECHRGGVRGDVHDAVVDNGKTFLTAHIRQRVGPGGTQLLDGVEIDLIERAVTRQIVAHAVGENIAWRVLVILEVVERLRDSGSGHQSAQSAGQNECPGFHRAIFPISVRIYAAHR